MVAENHEIVGGSAIAVAFSTGQFPGSGGRVYPAEVAFAVFHDPGVVDPFELFLHVVGHVPDCGAVLVVNFAVVPYLGVGVGGLVIRWEMVR